MPNPRRALLFTSWSLLSISILVILGWIFDIPLLKSIYPTWISMKLNTAICFGLCGLALLLYNFYPKSHILYSLAVLKVMLISIITIHEHVFSIDIIDNIFIRDTQEKIPGRMAITSALLFFIACICFGLLKIKNKVSITLISSLCFLITIIPVLTLTSYLYRADLLIKISTYTNHMAVHTCFGFIILVVGLLLSKVEGGFQEIIVSDYSGGQLLRKLLPPVLLFPVLFGYLRLKGEHLGYFTLETGVLIHSSTFTILFTSLLFWYAGVLDKADKQKILADKQKDELYLKYSTILDKAYDAFIAFDEKSVIVDWNQRSEELFGWKKEEVLGIKLEQTIIPIENIEKHYKSLNQFLQTGYGTYINKRVELPCVTRSGKSIPTEMTVSPVKLSNNTYLFCAFIHDISERLKQESKIQESNENLEQFAFMASHDLQEPIRHIGFFCKFLLGNKEFYDQAEKTNCLEYLLKIQEASNRMQSLVTDLLMFSRISTRSENFTRVDLTIVLKETIAALESDIREKNAKVTIGPLPFVNGSHERLKQVFINLISNAIKFSKDNINPEIKVFYEEETNFYSIFVQDNGIGFSNQYKDRIFNMFQRLHGASSKYEGTGIGLAICKKIIERHEGKITVTSIEGTGTTFNIILPIGGLNL